MRGEPLRLVIVGATSGIAQATARLYAKEGARLLLIGRSQVRLEQVAADARLRGAASAEVVAADLVNDDADAVLDAVAERWEVSTTFSMRVGS